MVSTDTSNVQFNSKKRRHLCEDKGREVEELWTEQ
jgi:hypothetical protein